MIVDHDELGPDGIRGELENARFANHCMSPCVASIEARDIGEWKDDHPLNLGGTWRAEFNRLFTAEKQEGREWWYYDGDGDPEPMPSVIGDDGDSVIVDTPFGVSRMRKCSRDHVITRCRENCVNELLEAKVKDYIRLKDQVKRARASRGDLERSMRSISRFARRTGSMSDDELIRFERFDENL